MITIVLHGYLKTLYDQEIKLVARTAAEAINGMCKQLKVFNPKPGQDRHLINVLGFDTKDSLYEDLTPGTELHLFPTFAGGKSGGGFIQIVIGAVLIAASFFIPGGPAILAAVSSAMFAIGASLALGGIMQLLSPSPNQDVPLQEQSVAQEDTKSQYLGAPGNTVRLGTPIPLLYGKHKIFGHFISYNVSTTNFVGPSTSTSTSTSLVTSSGWRDAVVSKLDLLVILGKITFQENAQILASMEDTHSSGTFKHRAKQEGPSTTAIDYIRLIVSYERLAPLGFINQYASYDLTRSEYLARIQAYYPNAWVEDNYAL